MKKKWFILFLLLMAVVIGGNRSMEKTADDYQLLDLASEQTLPLSDVVASLSRQRVVLVGEHHTNRDHHLKQLAVIRALHDAGEEVAIGMEMFRKGSQADLDRWVAGDLNEFEFREVFRRDWSFQWELYAPILEYARENRLPLVGLNVPPEITRQVARQGFASLTEEQRGRMPPVVCRVDKAYMDFIRKAFGAHAHGHMSFQFFCEAQLVWDSAMAVHALEYLKTKPETIMVLLAGTGHVHYMGIPARIQAESDIPIKVILPEADDNLSRERLSNNDADFLFLKD